MAGLLAVGIAILLAIVISVSYALVLRELRQINANLEQLIGLLTEAGRHDGAMREAPREGRTCRLKRGRRQQPQFSRAFLSCWG